MSEDVVRVELRELLELKVDGDKVYIEGGGTVDSEELYEWEMYISKGDGGLVRIHVPSVKYVDVGFAHGKEFSYMNVVGEHDVCLHVVLSDGVGG